MYGSGSSLGVNHFFSFTGAFYRSPLLNEFTNKKAKQTATKIQDNQKPLLSSLKTFKDCETVKTVTIFTFIYFIYNFQAVHFDHILTSHSTPLRLYPLPF